MNKKEIKEKVCEFIDRKTDNHFANIFISIRDIYGRGSVEKFCYKPDPEPIPYDITDNLDGWFKTKGSDTQFSLDGKDSIGVWFYYYGEYKFLTYQQFLDKCTHADDRPCGKVG